MKEPINYTDATWNVIPEYQRAIVTNREIRLETIPRNSFVYRVFYFRKEHERRAYFYAYTTYPMLDKYIKEFPVSNSDAIFEGTIVSREILGINLLTKLPHEYFIIKSRIAILDNTKNEWNVDGDDVRYGGDEMKQSRNNVDELGIVIDDWKHGVYGNPMDYICKLHETISEDEEAVMYTECILFIRIVKSFLINCTAVDYKPKMNIKISENENEVRYDFSITKNDLKCSFTRSFVVDPAFNYFSLRTAKDIKELVYKATFWTMQNYTEKEENANKYEKDLFEIFEKFNECVTKIQNDRLKI